MNNEEKEARQSYIKPKKIFISACETSSDKHAGAVIKYYLDKHPDTYFFGIGSVECKKAGMDVWLDMSRYSTVGIVEPIRFLPQIYCAYRHVKKWLKEESPDLYIPIDNQGFHMMTCKVAKKYKIPVSYFIAPQQWHWGTKAGAEKVRKVVDKIWAIFPQEAEFYQQCGVDAVYVGHPTTDYVRQARKKRKPEQILAIFPGSRLQEVERLLPLFFQAAKRFCQQTGLTPVVSIANKEVKPMILKQLRRDKKNRISYWDKPAIELMQKATISLVTSGTVSLENAFMGVPHVVAYKFHPMTYRLAITFFKKTVKKIPHMSLANILLKQRIFPELKQEEVSKETLISTLLKVYQDKEKRQEKKCKDLWKLCEKGSVVNKVYEQINQMLKETAKEK